MLGSTCVSEMNETSTVARSAGPGRSNGWWALVLSKTVTRLVARDAVVKLAAAHVDGVDLGRAALEQAVGEAAGGGPHVEADEAGGIDAEVVERTFELESAAAHEAGRPVEVDLSVGGDERSRLVDALAADAHPAGHDETPRLGAALGEAPLDEQDVEARLGWARAHRPAPARTPTAFVTMMPGR